VCRFVPRACEVTSWQGGGLFWWLVLAAGGTAWSACKFCCSQFRGLLVHLLWHHFMHSTCLFVRNIEMSCFQYCFGSLHQFMLTAVNPSSLQWAQMSALLWKQSFIYLLNLFAFSALTLLVWRQEGHIVLCEVDYYTPFPFAALAALPSQCAVCQYPSSYY